MIKKIIAVLTTILILMSFAAIGVNAESEDIAVCIDGKQISFPDAKPFINADSRTLCPIRFIAENLGAGVEWNGDTKVVVITNGSAVIKLTVGESTAEVNGVVKTFDTKAQIFQGRTYVPLRFISETFDMTVGWDNKTKTVSISRPDVSDLLKDQAALSDEEKKIAENLDQYLGSIEKNKKFHGSILVAKEGKVLLDKGYGNANYEQEIKNTPQTRFPIGSVTKQFTAMAIMQLYEKGLLTLDDKLSKYISGWPDAETITIKQLLTHSSGIVNCTEIPEFFSTKTEDLSEEYIINTLKGKTLEFAPGTKWKYSNSGYVLLGYIVEKVSGLSLNEYLDKNIFKPLDMKNTGICYKGEEKMYNATGYLGYLDLTATDDEFLLRGAYGAGFLCSTVEDLYRWDRALYTEKLVKKETMNMIFTGYEDTQTMGKYGLGWFVRDDESLGKVVFHGGNTLSFTADISRYVDKDIAIIMTINNGYYDVDTLTGILAGIVQGKKYELPSEPKAIELESGITDKYVGTYEYVKGYNIIITKSGDQLFAQVTGQAKAEIYPEAEDEFFYRSVDARISFKKNENSEVTGLVLKQGNADIEAKRIGSAPEEKKEIQLDAKIYESYVGEYELMKGFAITVSTDGEHLYAQATGQEQYEIFAQSETEFFYKVVDAELSFVKNDEGKVTGLLLKQGGQNLNLNKIK
ncbi:serine hydrolase [Acetivibrio cellulolyticus]|uniref:serine hydrolase n=1 Tax=Acetivibrio cellulolyticus TaxID=35830 RepID=UPI0001E2CBB6|nr:serine hydrolase [Acetivibrio cellulolyticus]